MVRLHGSNDDKVLRIDRLPKFVRDFARKHKLMMNDIVESYRFTGYVDSEMDNFLRIKHKWRIEMCKNA